MKFISKNEDETYTCTDNESGEIKRYRLATENDRDAHVRGELVDRTMTAYELEAEEIFKPFLLVQID